MHWYFALPLGVRLSLASAAVSALLVVFLVSLATATSPRNTLVDQSGAIIAEQLAQRAAGYVVEQDSLALQALLGELTHEPLIAYASIADADHQLIAESGTPLFNRKSMRRFTANAPFHGSVVGHVEIYLAGAASPAMSAVLVLFLGALVFSLVLLFVLLRLKALDHALQRMSRTLGSLLPGASPDEPVKSMADLHGVCEAMQKLVPLPSPEAARQRAVVALRLPLLAANKLEPQALAKQSALLVRAAESWQGTLRQCADGWQLLFTSGGDAPRRALCSAHFLQATANPDIDCAMAVTMEAVDAAEQDEAMRGFHWQRLCDEAHRLAHTSGAVTLTRLSLCDAAIHQRITVEQNDAGDYLVTGFSEEIEREVASRQPASVASALSHNALKTAC